MSTYLGVSRRNFLSRSAAASLAVLSGKFLAAQDAAPAPPAHLPLRDTMLKFNPDGSTRAFAGNTVISHLPAQSVMRDQMTLLHDALAAASFRGALGLTSVRSYHMTILNGANDQDRERTGWPPYVPKDAPIAVCNDMVRERMEKVLLHCELPIRVRVDQEATLRFATAATLRMSPANQAEADKLQSVRDQLAAVYGYRGKNHSSYEFHITMSYQLRDFTPAELAAYRAMLQAYLPKIVAAAPIVELGGPEYCTFADMQRFEPLLLLRSS